MNGPAKESILNVPEFTVTPNVPLPPPKASKWVERFFETLARIDVGDSFVIYHNPTTPQTHLRRKKLDKLYRFTTRKIGTKAWRVWRLELEKPTSSTLEDLK